MTATTAPPVVELAGLVKTAVAAIPVLLIYLLGVLTDAEGTASAWLLSGLLVLLGAGVFVVYGLAGGRCGCRWLT